MAFPTGWTRGRIDIDHTKVSGTASLTDFPVYLNEDNFGSAVFGNSQGKEINTNYLLDDDNLQGYWRMESGALTTDSGPNGYTLTNNNTVTEGTGDISAGCGDFEKDNTEYLSIADASCPNLTISGGQTWSCWIKLESVPNNLNMLGKYTSGKNIGLAYISASENIYFDMYGLTTSAVGSSVKVTTGVWYHIAGVYDSGEGKLKVFVNGVKTEVSTSGTVGDTGGDFCIGALNNSLNFFDGLIDDAAIWDRALSDEEVLSLYTGGADIRFSSDEAGAREIPREIVNWDIVNEEAEVHVKVPTVSDDTDTPIYVWYDNSNATPIGRELYTFDDLINDANLQGYWRMESDGTDSSGNSKTMTGQGTPTYSSGKFGNGISLNGTDQCLTIAYASASGLYPTTLDDPITISAWVKRDTTNTYDMIYSSYNTTDTHGLRVFINQTTNTITADCYGDGGNFSITSDVTVPTGEWAYVCFVRTTTTIGITINGITKTSNNSNSFSIDSSSGVISIGSSDNSEHFFDGLIDDVAIFDRALSDYEIAGLYGSGAGVWGSGYKAKYHLQDNFADSTVNANNLTNDGAVAATGKMSDAYDFEATNADNAYIADNASLSITGDITIAFWVNFESFAVNTQVISKSTLAGAGGWHVDFDGSVTKIRFRYRDSGGTNQTRFVADSAYSSPADSGSWKHIFISCDVSAGTVTWLENGSAFANTRDQADATSIGDNSETMALAAQYNAGSQSGATLDGLLDEVMIYSGLLSADYGATMYANQNSPSTFATFVSAIERTISDSIGLTDSTDRLSDVIRSVTDSIGVTDTIIKLQGFARALDDNIGMTDLVNAQSVMIVFLSDTMGITDSNDRVSSYAKIIEDSIGVDDTIERQLDVTREVTDSMGLTDSLVGGFVYIRILDDSMTLTDSITLEQAVLSKSKFKVSSVKETRATINRIIKNKPVVLIVN